MPLTAEQQTWRAGGIGGSDAAAILGIHPHRRPLDVYMEKVHGQRQDFDFGTAKRIRWGNLLEPVIRAEAAAHYGSACVVPPGVEHPAHPWMRGHLDGQFGDGTILEIKCAWFPASRGWGDEGTDQIPAAYLAQVQHYLEITGAERARVAALLDGHDLRFYEVTRDREFGALLVEIEGDFWRVNVQGCTPPPETDPERVRALLAALHPRDVEPLIKTDSAAVLEAARAVAAARKAAKAAKEAADARAAELAAFIGPAAGFDLGDAGQVLFRANKRGVRSLKVNLAGEEEEAA